MHRDFALSLLPAGADRSIPSLMAREIVARQQDGESTLTVLQRAGFTGIEIGAHRAEAERLAQIALTGSAIRPLPAGTHLLALNRALAAVAAAYPELTGVA